MQGLVLHDFKARLANIHSMYRVLSISMFPFHRLSCLSSFFLVLFLFTNHCIQNRFIVLARRGRFCIAMIVTACWLLFDNIIHELRALCCQMLSTKHYSLSLTPKANLPTSKLPRSYNSPSPHSFFHPTYRLSHMICLVFK